MKHSATEEYLEVIYKLSQDGPVRPSRIAEALGVSAPTVTAQLRRLKDRGLVTRPGGRVALTGEGVSAALAVVRSHRLSERFLADVLGLPLDEVHEEACRLEHALSPKVQEALEQFLESPEVCPHGHPIPSAEGTIAEVEGEPLSEVEVGRRVRIVQLAEDDEALLSYLASLGLLPGEEMTVRDVAPFRGPLLVEIGGSQYAIGREVAGRVLVRPASGR